MCRRQRSPVTSYRVDFAGAEAIAGGEGHELVIVPQRQGRIV